MMHTLNVFVTILSWCSDALGHVLLVGWVGYVCLNASANSSRISPHACAEDNSDEVIAVRYSISSLSQVKERRGPDLELS